MYRVSVTTIEKFRRVIHGVSSFDTEEALIESLKGEFKGNDKTKIGHAYHKIIEGESLEVSLPDGKKKLKFIKAEDIHFTKDQAAPALAYREAHPGMVHEMNVRKIYESIIGPFQVSGRVDGVDGARIHDGKTKFREVDFAEYHDSSQWKFYLDMLDSEQFYYDLFEFRGFKKLSLSQPVIVHKDVKVIVHEPFECIRYSDMQGEIVSLLNDFLTYIRNKDFFHLLKPAIEVQENEFNLTNT